jgi:hypothetical protein
MSLDVAGVHPADAAAAEHGETNHLLSASLLPCPIRLSANSGFDTRRTKGACVCLQDKPVTLEYDFKPDATVNFQFFYGTKCAFHFPADWDQPAASFIAALPTAPHTAKRRPNRLNLLSAVQLIPFHHPCLHHAASTGS